MLKRTKKSQHLAIFSLAVMGVGFVVTIPFQQLPWIAILQGGFESGVVGGLADWFAVTALFRHPLGIPIPHTALLPKNRNRITATIISMLENDWLTKESIKEKIKTIPFTDKILTLIEKEKNSDAAKDAVTSVIKKVIQHIDCHQIAPLIEKELKSQLHSLDIKSYLPTVVDQISERKYDQKALDYILNEIDEWANKESTKNRLGRLAVEAIENIKADGFMQFALKSFSNLVNEDKLGSIIQTLIQKGVSSFREPSNQNRLTLLWNIQTKLQNIKSDEKFIQEINQWKTQLVNNWLLEDRILELLIRLKDHALDFVEKPAFYETYILSFVNNSINNLKKDPTKKDQIENWIRKHIFSYVEENHSKIGKLVEENLEKLDDKTLIEMLENNVGKDLQWIRVNGAICGFLIGIILAGIRAIF